MSPDDRSYVQQLGEVLRQRTSPRCGPSSKHRPAATATSSQVDAIRAQSDAEIEALLH